MPVATRHPPPVARPPRPPAAAAAVPTRVPQRALKIERRAQAQTTVRQEYQTLLRLRDSEQVVKVHAGGEHHGPGGRGGEAVRVWGGGEGWGGSAGRQRTTATAAAIPLPLPPPTHTPTHPHTGLWALLTVGTVGTVGTEVQAGPPGMSSWTSWGSTSRRPAGASCPEAAASSRQPRWAGGGGRGRGKALSFVGAP